MRVPIRNIVWDTYDVWEDRHDDVELPTEVTITIPAPRPRSNDNFGDYITAVLEQHTGWLTMSFEWQQPNRPWRSFKPERTSINEYRAMAREQLAREAQA